MCGLQKGEEKKEVETVLSMFGFLEYHVQSNRRQRYVMKCHAMQCNTQIARRQRLPLKVYAKR